MRNKNRGFIEPWYQRNNGERLRQDQALIANNYPGLTFHIDKQTQACTLSGDVVHRSECGVPTPITVQIKIPHGYPKAEPRVYETGHQFEHIADRHFYDDGRCCLWLSEESRWNQTDANSLKWLLDEVMVFFDRQLVYDALPLSERRWPGPERSHGVVGYLEYALELVGGDKDLLLGLLLLISRGLGNARNQPCPCGENRKVKHCHLPLMTLLTRSIQQDRLKSLTRYIQSKARIS